MADFAAVISTGSNTYVIDAIDSFVVAGISDMQTHPLVSGDLVGDHMIKQGASLNISGSFGMNASTKQDSLSSIQKQFEDIRDNAILCTVARVKTVNNEFRFLKRNNMALTGITWTERNNSLDFQFTFNQALLGSIQVTTRSSDSLLPEIVEPSTLSLQGSVISTSDLLKQVINVLYESGIVDEVFLNELGNDLLSAGWVIAIGLTAGLAACVTATAIATGTTAIGAVVALGAGSATVPVAGWVVAGICAVTAACIGIGMCIYNAVQRAKTKAAIKYLKFDSSKLEGDYEERRAEIQRFDDMMSEIYTNIAKINDIFKVYSFVLNSSQEVMLTVDGNHYIFTITKDNLSNSWSCKVSQFTSSGETTICSKSINYATDLLSASAGNAFCTLSGAITKNYVFFVTSTHNTENLTETYLMIASEDPSKFEEVLEDIIEEALLPDNKKE